MMRPCWKLRSDYVRPLASWFWPARMPKGRKKIRPSFKGPLSLWFENSLLFWLTHCACPWTTSEWCGHLLYPQYLTQCMHVLVHEHPFISLSVCELCVCDHLSHCTCVVYVSEFSRNLPIRLCPSQTTFSRKLLHPMTQRWLDVRDLFGELSQLELHSLC